MADIDVNATRSRFVCNLGAMNPEQRERHAALSRKLRGANEERRELENGYAFRLAGRKISLMEIAEWIAMERLCCPFFNLRIEVEADSGPTWLHITGRGEIKPFIRAEIGG